MIPVIFELMNLTKDENVEIEIIIKWLDENKKHYDKVKKINDVLHLNEIDGEVIRLPDFSDDYKNDEQFLTVFEKLTELNNYHSLEDYYKGQLATLAKILKDDSRLKEFYDTNIKYYKNEMFSFFIDFTENEVSSNWVGITIHSPTHHIQINPENFNYTFKFHQVFENQFKN